MLKIEIGEGVGRDSHVDVEATQILAKSKHLSVSHMILSF